MAITRRELLTVGLVGGLSGAGLASLVCWLPMSRVRRWMARTHLSVKVTGLIGMAQRNGGTELLLVDGDQTLNEPHLPRLLAPAEAVFEESTPPSGVDGDRVFWSLANQRATLISGASGGTTKVTGLRNPDEVLRPRADGGSHRDVTWIARMSKIPAAGGGAVNPKCFDDNPKSAKVASRVRFNGGSVEGRFKHPFHQVVWQIGDSGTTPEPFKQALGELRVSQTIPSERVVFRLEPFDGAPSSDIVLIRTDSVNLEVEIANLPRQVVCTSSSHANNLAHFVAFYELLATPPTSKPVPSCQTNCPGCGHQGEPIYCPPADYDGT